MFEIATREGYTYQTCRGLADTTTLWKMPLESVNGYNLDAVAIAIHKELEELGEISFVKKDNNSKRRKELDTKLEIVKYIIKTRQDENDKKVQRIKVKEEKERLKNLIERKKEAADEAKSLEELEKALAELEEK